jgi:hypothetical protein
LASAACDFLDTFGFLGALRLTGFFAVFLIFGFLGGFRAKLPLSSFYFGLASTEKIQIVFTEINDLVNQPINTLDRMLDFLFIKAGVADE